MELMKYKYYDTPDGQDCFPKMFYISKYAASVGLAVGVNDVVLVSKPVGYLATAGRIMYFVGPLTFAAATFSGTTCIAGAIRGKDDRTNYVLGGLSSGAVIGTWLKSAYRGGQAAVIFAIAGYMKKKSLEEGWAFFPPRPEGDRQILGNVGIDYSSLKRYDTK